MSESGSLKPWEQPGNRLTASSNPRARDWKIIEDVGNKTLSEDKEKSRQRQSVLRLGETREEAERALWRVRNVNRHLTKKWKLQMFYGPHGWDDAPPRRASEVTGINPEWSGGLTLVHQAG